MNKGHTAKLLVLLHEQLEHRGPPDSVDEGGDEAVPYAVYADAARKTWRANVRDTFGRMLRAVPGCGPGAVEDILKVAPTPTLLQKLLNEDPAKVPVGPKLRANLAMHFGQLRS